MNCFKKPLLVSAVVFASQGIFFHEPLSAGRDDEETSGGISITTPSHTLTPYQKVDDEAIYTVTKQLIIGFNKFRHQAYTSYLNLINDEKAAQKVYKAKNVSSQFKAYTSTVSSFQSLKKEEQELVSSYVCALFLNEKASSQFFPKSKEARKLSYNGRTFLRYNVPETPDALFYAFGSTRSNIISRIIAAGEKDSETAQEIRNRFWGSYKKDKGMTGYSGLAFYGQDMSTANFVSTASKFYDSRKLDQFAIAYALQSIENVKVYFWTLDADSGALKPRIGLSDEPKPGAYHILDLRSIFKSLGVKDSHYQILIDAGSDETIKRRMLAKENVARVLSGIDPVEE